MSLANCGTDLETEQMDESLDWTYSTGVPYKSSIRLGFSPTKHITALPYMYLRTYRQQPTSLSLLDFLTFSFIFLPETALLDSDFSFMN